jgi:hypothetical protein
MSAGGLALKHGAQNSVRRCDDDRFASDSVKATGGPPAPRLSLKDEAVGTAEAGPAPALHPRYGRAHEGLHPRYGRAHEGAAPTMWPCQRGCCAHDIAVPAMACATIWPPPTMALHRRYGYANIRAYLWRELGTGSAVCSCHPGVQSGPAGSGVRPGRPQGPSAQSLGGGGPEVGPTGRVERTARSPSFAACSSHTDGHPRRPPPHRSGLADFPHPAPLVRASLCAG